MANFVFNIAKGRVAEFYNRVDTDDPANSRLVIVPLVASGLPTEATLKPLDTLAAVLATAADEQGTMGRKYLIQSDLAAFSTMVNDTPGQDRVDLDIPDITWTTATGAGVGALLVCYEPDSTSPSDAAIIPLTHHDFAVTPDGSDIVAVIAATGFFRAS